jgi:pseudaminic acid cytidylyltransferase
MQDINTVAIIPARGGSKRIPRKNIRSFASRPIIAYSIDAAKEAGCFSDVIISTEDQEIADVARSCGATVPFMRSRNLADDASGISEVLKEVVGNYEIWAKRSIDFICCILPTAPFVLAKNIFDGYRLISDNEINAVISVTQYSYPIQRALNANGRYISMIWPENYNKRSQDFEPSYHDAGQFYWIRKSALFEYNRIFVPQTAFVCIEECRSQDIDTEEDWKYAELKWAILKGKNNI